jgi:hypothetical protein
MQIPWSEYIYYDETSPSCLRWKIDRGNHARKDGHVGSVNKGRWSFVFSFNSIKKRRYNHRVIWELLKGSTDNLEIDHIDGNPLNNKISNLRLVSREINGRNCKINSRNSSGITGVSFVTVQGYDYYVASWKEKGIRMLKHFSCLKLGADQAKLAAISFRIEKIKNIGGYTQRHGI